MRIDTTMAQAYPSFSMIADNSYSSMNTTPTTPSQSPMDANLYQAFYQPTNYLAAEGDGDNGNFLTSPGFDGADNSWMGEFLTDTAFDDNEGAGFGMGGPPALDPFA